jgi:predicted anti-sigma-YlaC factor YlaD
MNCTEVNQHLDAWLDQALDSELAGMVEAHVSQCAACRAERSRLQALKVVLQSSEIYQPAAALEARVISAFHEHHRQPRATAVDGWRRE